MSLSQKQSGLIDLCRQYHWKPKFLDSPGKPIEKSVKACMKELSVCLECKQWLLIEKLIDYLKQINFKDQSTSSMILRFERRSSLKRQRDQTLEHLNSIKQSRDASPRVYEQAIVDAWLKDPDHAELLDRLRRVLKKRRHLDEVYQPMSESLRNELLDFQLNNRLLLGLLEILS